MEEKNIKQETNKIKNNKVKIIIGIVLLLITIFLIFILTKGKKEYTITFDSNGGSLVDTMIITENDTIPEPENPTKPNNEFVGWYYNNQLYDFSKPVICDMTLKARWAMLENMSTGIKLDKTQLTLNIGETTTLIATVANQDNKEEVVIWQSSNPDIVSVDSNGNITALKEGNATIIVSINNGQYIAKAQVIVNGKDTTDTIVDNTETPSNGVQENTAGNKKPTTNTNTNTNNNNSNSNNNNNNNVTPPNKNDKENVTEEEKNETIINTTGVRLNTTALNLTEGDNSKLTATVNPSNANNKNVTWVSSNPDIVSVDANGNIKALNPGMATIIVTSSDGGYTAKATITVNRKNVNVTGVTLNTSILNLTEGNTTKLTATINPSNADNKNVTWVSSNPNIVSVDANGNVRALKAGTATITVTTSDGNYKATCQITVKEKAPSYSVIFTPIVQPTGTYQYAVSVTKNNSTFNDFNFIIYNGKKVGKGSTLSSTQYNRNESTATIWLSDGNKVTATVVYK